MKNKAGLTLLLVCFLSISCMHCCNVSIEERKQVLHSVEEIKAVLIKDSEDLMSATYECVKTIQGLQEKEKGYQQRLVQCTDSACGVTEFFEDSKDILQATTTFNNDISSMIGGMLQKTIEQNMHKIGEQINKEKDNLQKLKEQGKHNALLMKLVEERIERLFSDSL